MPPPPPLTAPGSPLSGAVGALSPLPRVGARIPGGFQSTHLPLCGGDGFRLSGHDGRWREDRDALLDGGVRHLAARSGGGGSRNSAGLQAAIGPYRARCRLNRAALRPTGTPASRTKGTT